MAKVTYVKAAKARKPGKPDRVCGKCGAKIEIGQPYRHWSFRYGGKHVRCMASVCNPTPVDLETNAFRRDLIRIGENLEREITTLADEHDPEGIATMLETYAQEVRELGEEQRGKFDEMPENFQSGDVGQLLEARADGCAEKADALDEIANTARGMEREEDEEDAAFAQRIRDEIGCEIDLEVD